MKKLISVLLSITLAVLCFSSLVLSADTAETAQEYWKEYRKHPVSGCFFCEFEQFYFNTSKHSSELLDTTEHAFAAFLGKCKENFSRIL